MNGNMLPEKNALELVFFKKDLSNDFIHHFTYLESIFLSHILHQALESSLISTQGGRSTSSSGGGVSFFLPKVGSACFLFSASSWLKSDGTGAGRASLPVSLTSPPPPDFSQNSFHFLRCLAPAQKKEEIKQKVCNKLRYFHSHLSCAELREFQERRRRTVRTSHPLVCCKPNSYFPQKNIDCFTLILLDFPEVLFRREVYCHCLPIPE